MIEHFKIDMIEHREFQAQSLRNSQAWHMFILKLSCYSFSVCINTVIRSHMHTRYEPQNSSLWNQSAKNVIHKLHTSLGSAHQATVHRSHEPSDWCCAAVWVRASVKMPAPAAAVRQQQPTADNSTTAASRETVSIGTTTCEHVADCNSGKIGFRIYFSICRLWHFLCFIWDLFLLTVLSQLI